MANKALDLFDPTCKDDAKWYACEATSSNRSPFVGCCKTDPCSVSGCALGNLAPVAFNASAYGTLPDPTCGSASTFYSCVNMPKNDTTFWGCCKSNACNHVGEPDNKSCPQNDLTGALLDSASLQQAYSLDGSGGSAAPTKSHTGAIIGGAVAAGVLVLVILALLLFCLFKKRRAKRASPPPHREKTEYRHSHSPHDEAPPLYTSPQPQPQPFAAFGAHQYAPVAAEPQELPAAAPTQRYSELPAEAVAPVELESPMVGAGTFRSPGARPRIGGEERPRTADTTYRVSMGVLGSPR